MNICTINCWCVVKCFGKRSQLLQYFSFVLCVGCQIPIVNSEQKGSQNKNNSRIMKHRINKVKNLRNGRQSILYNVCIIPCDLIKKLCYTHHTQSAFILFNEERTSFCTIAYCNCLHNCTTVGVSNLSCFITNICGILHWHIQIYTL